MMSELLIATPSGVQRRALTDAELEQREKDQAAVAEQEAAEQTERAVDAQRDQDWRDAIVTAAKAGDLERAAALIAGTDDDVTADAVARGQRRNGG